MDSMHLRQMPSPKSLRIPRLALLLSMLSTLALGGCVSPGPYHHLQHCALDAKQWRYLESPPPEAEWIFPFHMKKPPEKRELISWFESTQAPRALVACTLGPDWNSHLSYAGCGSRKMYLTPEMLEKKVVPKEESLTTC